MISLLKFCTVDGWYWFVRIHELYRIFIQ